MELHNCKWRDKKPDTHSAEIYELFEMNVWIIYALFFN